jgi:hypothetical protein
MFLRNLPCFSAIGGMYIICICLINALSLLCARLLLKAAR